PQQREMAVMDVDLKLTCDLGEPFIGEDNDPDNPLSRAVRILMRDGKPFRSLSLAFLRESGHAPLLWLGAFVVTQGGRVVFFPGVGTTIDRIQLAKGAELRHDRLFSFDHVSLDWTRDGIPFHVTTAGSTDHIGGPSAMPVGDDRFLWFGASIRRREDLR